MPDNWSAEETDDPPRRPAQLLQGREVEQGVASGSMLDVLTIFFHLDAGGLISSGTFSGVKYFSDLSSKTKR
jgi:hypothetical protein